MTNRETILDGNSINKIEIIDIFVKKTTYHLTQLTSTLLFPYTLNFRIPNRKIQSQVPTQAQLNRLLEINFILLIIKSWVTFNKHVNLLGCPPLTGRAALPKPAIPKRTVPTYV